MEKLSATSAIAGEITLNDRATRVLVTGFSPFLGESINPSAVLLTWIQSEFGARVDTILLPVSFRQAPEIVAQHLQQKDYDIILLLGQAGGRARVSLERVALNWLESDYPDEEAFTPQQGVIQSDGAPALFSPLPLTDWKNKLLKKNLPVEISLSAGGYVCNYLYYRTLQWLQQNGKGTSTCFIHVPYLPEQVSEKTNVPSLELSQMKAALSDILSWYV